MWPGKEKEGSSSPWEQMLFLEPTLRAPWSSHLVGTVVHTQESQAPSSGLPESRQRPELSSCGLFCCRGILLTLTQPRLGHKRVKRQSKLPGTGQGHGEGEDGSEAAESSNPLHHPSILQNRARKNISIPDKVWMGFPLQFYLICPVTLNKLFNLSASQRPPLQTDDNNVYRPGLGL